MKLSKELTEKAGEGIVCEMHADGRAGSQHYLNQSVCLSLQCSLSVYLERSENNAPSVSVCCWRFFKGPDSIRKDRCLCFCSSYRCRAGCTWGMSLGIYGGIESQPSPDLAGLAQSHRQAS